VAPRKQSRVGRVLAAFLLAIVGLYSLIFAKGWEPRLGLDLRGGTSVILTPDDAKGRASDDAVDKAVDIIRQRVNGTGVSEAEVVREGRNIVVSLPDVGRDEATRTVGRTARLTFRGVVAGPINGDPNAEPEETESPSPSPSASGSAGATPKPSGSASGSTAKPGGSASTRPSGSATSTASSAPTVTPIPTPPATAPANGRAVTGNLLAQATPSGSGTPTTRPSAPAPTPVPEQPTPQQPQIDPALQGLFLEVDCTDAAERARIAALDDPAKQIVACSRDGEAKYLLSVAEATGDIIKDASATLDQTSSGATTGAWVIDFKTTDDGAKKFGEISEKYTGQQLAIVLDGVVQSAPTINSKITTEGQITGDFKQEEAKDLANVLRYGALPVTFDASEVLSISPTLGDESLDGGLKAGVLGIGLVILYVLAYYRGLGLVTVAGLFVFGALNYALIVILGNLEEVGFTLTLAGIAGLIISVGISADSYVVFYERIKDEVKAGRTVRLAVDRAYSSAIRTIIAADIVSFIAAAALYALSVGAVRGFAFTLGMATLLDLLMSFCFARPLVTMLAKTRLIQNSSALGLKQPKADLVVKEA
jgi:preprotein translocase subunit SecD